MQDGALLCRPELEEELMALLSIYDSELNVERKFDGSVSLKLKISPVPPAYIKATVTLHLPAAVRNCPAFHTCVCSPFSSTSLRRIHQRSATCSVRYP